MAGTLGGGLLARLSTGLVHLVEEVQAGHLEIIGLLLDLSSGQGTLTSLALGDELAESGDLLLDALGLGLVQAVGELVQGLLSVVDNAVGAVGSLNGSLALLVGLGVLLGVLDHLLDLVVGQTRAGGNGDRLVLVGGLVLGMDVDNGVGINVEGNLDLRDTTVGRGDADQLEVAEHLVVLDELTLTLVDLDLNSSLEVGGSREDLGLLGGDGGVAVDQTSEDTTEGLNTQGQRSNVQEQKVLNLTREDSTLDSSTNGDSLIRVDGLGGVTAEDALDGLSDLGHAGHTTNEDNLLDVLGLEAGVLEGLLDGLDGPADERVDHLLKLSTGELQVDVLGAGGISGDEGQVDVSLERRRQLDLSLLSSLTDTLDSHAVAGQVESGGLLEVLNHVANEVDVEVLTTEVGVTVGRLDLEDTVLDLQDGDIESTTTKIVDSDNTVGLLLETVGEGSSGGLVNDTENVQASDLTGILGGLTLGVVEVGRDGNNGVLDGLAEVGLGGLLHLLEDESTDLGRRVVLATGRDPGVAVGVLDNLVWHLLDVALDLNVGELSADQSLGGEEGVLGVNDGLTLGGNTDQTLAILGEGNY
ncbi:hypothetical protein VMCG_05263 [Cytospora schulzeri]|uniref:Uncharacterized protein n=1 Tax=Cytospora schulzeri TaxID=448051 RepID=A0A423WQR3_9PEZI|nr:hypothetical protein VMCG_05263 [Valsa malicola]